MTEVWALPGYDVQALIGYGSTGEVWRARELSTGELVALKRLRPEADPEAVASLRRDAAMLRALDTPYVVRLRAVLVDGPETVLVLDLATGGSLASLLARRGALDPAEVVTIGAPLAQALAAAHACGLVHGDVSATNVLFTAEGMPLLADLGLARLAGSVPDASSDVRSLAALCHHLLSGTPPSEDAQAPLGLLAPTAPLPLVVAIEAALSADPAVRPDAAAFAADLRRSHAAAPVRFAPTSAPRPEPSPVVEPARVAPPAPVARAARRWVPAAAAALVLVSAAGIGWASGRSGPAELASAATPAPAPDWRAVVDGLDATRASAFASTDAGLLAEVYAPGSPLLSADRSVLTRLASSGLRARGVRHTTRTIDVTSYDERSAHLRLVDVLAAYDVVDARDRVVRHVSARPAAAFVVTVVSTPGGWRIAQVARV